jgi:hypothetical protein
LLQPLLPQLLSLSSLAALLLQPSSCGCCCSYQLLGG